MNRSVRLLAFVLLACTSCTTMTDMMPGGGGDGMGDMSTNGTMDGGGDNGGGDGGGTPTLTIRSVTPDAVNDQLFLSGQFGEGPGVVKVGSQTLNVVSWGPAAPQPQQIVCDLPREAFGNVQVQNGNDFSNVAQLTRWDLELVSKTVIASPSATGQLNINITVNLIIRACINDLLPHSPPGFTVLAAVSRGSTSSIEASGTQVLVPPPTFNSSTFSAATPPGQIFRVIYPGDTFDSNVDRFTISGVSCFATRNDAGGGGLKPLFTYSGFYNEIQTLDAMVFNSEQLTGFATNTYFDTTQPILFEFSGAFDIVSGMATAANNPSSTLEWKGAAAQSPPVD